MSEISSLKFDVHQLERRVDELERQIRQLMPKSTSSAPKRPRKKITQADVNRRFAK